MRICLILLPILSSTLALAQPAPLDLIATLDDTNAPATGSSRLRFVNAGADTGAVDVYLDGALTFQEIGLGASTGYVDIQNGTLRVRVEEAGSLGSGTPFADQDVSLAAGEIYQLIGAGLAADLELELIEGGIDNPSGVPRVRFLNASPDSPPLDLVIEGELIFPAVAFGELREGLVELPDEALALELRRSDTGTPMTALSVPRLELPAAEVMTLYAIGLLSASPPGEPCSDLYAELMADLELCFEGELETASGQRPCFINSENRVFTARWYARSLLDRLRREGCSQQPGDPPDGE